MLNKIKDTRSVCLPSSRILKWANALASSTDNDKKTLYLKLSIKKRFWNKVKIRKKDECWDWIGANQKQGYGRFRIDNKLYGSHIVAYILTFGGIPNNLWVLHKCDNPKCVNPNHLFLGTRSDNMKDAYKKNRLKMERLYESNPHKKLNYYQIEEIILLIKKGLTEREIGKLFNISYQSVNYIKHKKAFK